jgi:hypothetical protein
MMITAVVMLLTVVLSEGIQCSGNEEAPEAQEAPESRIYR